MQEHIVNAHQLHYGWDRNNPPVLTVAPGDTVTFNTVDAGGGQITRHSSIKDVSNFDFSRINPTFGPIFIDDAQPGDALQVTVLSLETEGWGWTANIPGFGLLSERFTEPALHIWEFDASNPRSALYGPGGEVPLKPFPGILGTAPPQEGIHPVVSPRKFGGNMDCRDIAEGVKLLLPVGVSGALFSCGDGHAAQGDGEICGTAIEAPMKVTLRFDLIKGLKLHFPRFTTTKAVTSHCDTMGYEVTMAMGPDLHRCARDAANDMVDLISAQFRISPVETYLLMSTCADLRISEIVDAPNWIVSCYFPRAVFLNG